MEFTFENFDKLNRKPLADRLTKAISSFYPFTDGAYVLSLNAKFGSGKTTFLKMWQQQLLNQGHKVIYLNAWETDFDEDPIIPLTACLLDNIGSDIDELNTKNALMKVIGAGALIGNRFIEHATGIDIQSTIKDTESTFNEKSLKEIGEEIYKSYNYKLKSYRNLDDLLSKYVKGLETKPVFIFVDELDRVRPNYSVRFLEAIKHIFSIRGICFVLAVDRKQLECSVKQLYGGIDFDNYYLRFVTREIDFNEKHELDIINYIKSVSNNYLEAENSKFCFNLQQKNEIIEYTTLICRLLRFTPRQVEYFLRVMFHLFAVENSDRIVRENWVYAAIFLIAVMIDNPDIYKKIGLGRLNAIELNKYISSFNYKSGERDSNRYILFNALAFNLRSQDNENDRQTAQLITEFENMNVLEADKFDIYREKIKHLSSYVHSFGYRDEKSGFQSIYNTIEDWKSFIE